MSIIVALRRAYAASANGSRFPYIAFTFLGFGNAWRKTSYGPKNILSR
jgi:hypothetical protein